MRSSSPSRRSASPTRSTVAPDGFLVFTWPGSNSPSIRADEDLTYQAIRAERGFERLEEVAQSVVRDDDFSAENPTLVQRVLDADTDYSEACLVVLRPRAALPRACARRRRPDHPRRRRQAAARRHDRSTARIELLDGAEPADDREADLQRQLVES